PPAEVDFYRPVIDVLWSAFGEDRLIYGSNWPVSDRFAPLAAVQQLVATYFAEKGATASEKYFRRNSRTAYKWIDRPKNS
ncbi:MAG TPA: amidohydrolase family protein, partial [Planctomycetaceae bacterium]|nr:amidohydrolase family protein [Planctomycetaceae bacterium]